MTFYNPGDTFRRVTNGTNTDRNPNHAVDGRVHTVARLQAGSRMDVIDTDGTAHWGANIALVARAADIAPATVEQVQEIVARANTISTAPPEPGVFRPGDRVRRHNQAPYQSGRYSQPDREPFIVSRVHTTGESSPGRSDCAVDPEENHHYFQNLEHAPLVDTTVITMQPLTTPANWGQMELWEQELLNPFQVGDIVRRKVGTGDSDREFTISAFGTDSGGRNLSTQMTTTGDEWHHVVNLVLQRRPEPATLETNTNPTTTEGTTMTHPQNGDVVQRVSTNLHPGHHSPYVAAQVQFVVASATDYGCTDPAGVTHAWGYLERVPNALSSATNPARVAGRRGFAIGDIVRTKEAYVAPSTNGRRKDQTPWTVVDLDSDDWPMDEHGYYNPAHFEIVTKAGEQPQVERIEINDPRVAWIWEAAATAADEEGFCPEYERLAARLGVPGRVHKFRVTAESRGALTGVLSMEVESSNARDARAKMVEALGSSVADRYRINVVGL